MRRKSLTELGLSRVTASSGSTVIWPVVEFGIVVGVFTYSDRLIGLSRGGVQPQFTAKGGGVVPVFERQRHHAIARIEDAVRRPDAIVAIEDNIQSLAMDNELTQIDVPISFDVAVGRYELAEFGDQIERWLFELGRMGIEPDKSRSVAQVADINASLAVDFGRLAALKQSAQRAFSSTL
jgi:hypothetical protein